MISLWELLKQAHGLPATGSTVKLFKPSKGNSGGQIETPNYLRTADNDILYTTNGQALVTEE